MGVVPKRNNKFRLIHSLYCQQEPFNNIKPLTLHLLGHCVLFICFRSEKNQNLIREGGKKKHLRKNIEPIFGKVNEGAQIKETFDKFLEKLMRATK